MDGAMNNSKAATSYIDMAECISTFDECTSSASLIGWSPHNVLHVATHFAVFLHTNNLLTSDAVIRPNVQRNVRNFSNTCVSGAKWALNLAPHLLYPATCRFCVRTTRDLIVYHVARYGDGRVRVRGGLRFVPCSAEAMGRVDDTLTTDITGAKRGKRASRITSKISKGCEREKPNDCGECSTIDPTGECIVSYEWFPGDLLVVVTVGGVYLLNMPDDIGGMEEKPMGQEEGQTPFPRAAYSFDNKSSTSMQPTCAARVEGSDAVNMRLLVASPLFLRLFGVSSTEVELIYCVEVPMLNGIPSSLCCFCERPEEPALHVFVSSPLLILHGTIVPCDVAMKPSAHTGPSAEAISREVRVKRGAEWMLVDVWGPDGVLGDDVSVARFIVVSLGSFAFSESELISPRGVTGGAPFIILGLCRRRLVGFFGSSCTKLIQCEHTDPFNPLSPEAGELAGLAIHPSCSLGVVAFQPSTRKCPPFQLFPVPVQKEGGFMERMLQCQGYKTFLSPSDEQEANRCKEMFDTNPPRLLSVLNDLYGRQTCASYFLWERLLPQNCLMPEINATRNMQHSMLSRLVSTTYYKTLGNKPHALDVFYKLHKSYLALRQEFGIELFLRFPQKCALWRQTLLRMHRLYGDQNCITLELLVANAVQILSEAISYGGFRMEDEASFLELCEGVSATMAVNAALQFAKLYSTLMEKENVLMYTPQFRKSLSEFIAVFEAEWKSVAHRTALEMVEPTRCDSHGGEQGQNSDGNGKECDSFCFPCSICNEATRNTVNIKLFAKSQEDSVPNGNAVIGCSKGHHITVFSCTTFEVVNFFSQDHVVSLCLSCGLYDYARGPLCTVCEGLMM